MTDVDKLLDDLDDHSKLIALAAQVRVHRSAATAALTAYLEHLTRLRDAIDQQVNVLHRIISAHREDAEGGE